MVIINLKEPLDEETKTKIIQAFDSMNIWSGSSHWWSTHTPEDNPSAHPKIRKDGSTCFDGTDFTEGNLGTYLCFGKDLKTLIVDVRWNLTSVLRILKKQTKEYEIPKMEWLLDPYLNRYVEEPC